MDDRGLMTSSIPASKIVIQRAVVALKWIRMKLNSQKSSVLVLKGGKCLDEQPFEIEGEIKGTIKYLRQSKQCQC